MIPFNNPALFEINARILLNRTGHKSLLEIPSSYWKSLYDKGISYIWLMGVWKIPEKSIAKYCFEPQLVKEYKSVLPDWNECDVIGSPYAIEDYVINPGLGKSNSELKTLKLKLNKIGLKLLLDFIPNHFNAESSLLKSNPEIFIPGPQDLKDVSDRTYFLHAGSVFAHGKDPYFEAWQDTAQVNYLNIKAQDFMISRLVSIAPLCDGVRCDMAMLVISHVFRNTWHEIISADYHDCGEEFWVKSIETVKRLFPDFLFIAEAYWDLEWKLQQMGFDFTYDKKLYDRLVRGNAVSIKNHLKADPDYQLKSLRFIENHDEKRAAEIFGKEMVKAAAVIISTIPGLRLYFEGQFEGYKIKLPVQLGREPVEFTDNESISFYEKLMDIVKENITASCKWELLEPEPAWENNSLNSNFLVWQIRNDENSLLVSINYSGVKSQCRLYPALGDTEDILLLDLLNEKKYKRNSTEISREGLYIELGPFQGHIFKF